MPAPKKVPARFVGVSSVKLSAAGRPYHDADGIPLESLILHPGDTLMIPPHEAYGETLYWPNGPDAQPYSLGFGKVALPEHVGIPTSAETQEPLLRTKAGEPRGYTAAELAALGYEFQTGRGDFVPLQALTDYLASLPAEPSEVEEPTIADLRAFIPRPDPSTTATAAAPAAPTTTASATPKPTAAKPAAPTPPDAGSTPPADA